MHITFKIYKLHTICSYIPVALGDISFVTFAMTVTLNGICCDMPVNTNVTTVVNNPSDSGVEYLESLNPTQLTKIITTCPINEVYVMYYYISSHKHTLLI